MDEIITSGGYAASQRYARELEERFNVSFKEEMQGNGLPVAALVSIENGCPIKHTMAGIYNPEKEIKKEQHDIEKYTKAVERKEAELVTLRKKEDYVGITTAANYRREYQTYLDRAVMRCEHLKKQAPLLIDQSILQAVEFIKLLKEETAKAEQLIADAKKMKAEYETAKS